MILLPLTCNSVEIQLKIFDISLHSLFQLQFYWWHQTNLIAFCSNHIKLIVRRVSEACCIEIDLLWVLWEACVCLLRLVNYLE